MSVRVNKTSGRSPLLAPARVRESAAAHGISSRLGSEMLRVLIAIVLVVLVAVAVPSASARPATRAPVSVLSSATGSTKARAGDQADLSLMGAASHVLGHRVSTRTVPGVVTATVVQTTGDLSQALRPLRTLRFAGDGPVRHVAVIHVRANVRFQRFAGVGAALTDSSAWLIGTQLSPAARRSLMSQLFGVAGIHLSFLRLPMGSSDFSVAGQPYTYDDLPVGESDVALAHFSIGHDLAYVIPTLQQAVALNPRVEIVAIPWSPPAWMKGNSALNNLGILGRCCPETMGRSRSTLSSFSGPMPRMG